MLAYATVRAPFLRECSRMEYGLQFCTEICGSKWEKTVFHEIPQTTCSVLTDISEHLQKLLDIYGKL